MIVGYTIGDFLEFCKEWEPAELRDYFVYDFSLVDQQGELLNINPYCGLSDIIYQLDEKGRYYDYMFNPTGIKLPVSTVQDGVQGYLRAIDGVLKQIPDSMKEEKAAFARKFTMDCAISPADFEALEGIFGRHGQNVFDALRFDVSKITKTPLTTTELVKMIEDSCAKQSKLFLRYRDFSGVDIPEAIDTVEVRGMPGREISLKFAWADIFGAQINPLQLRYIDEMRVGRGREATDPLTVYQPDRMGVGTLAAWVSKPIITDYMGSRGILARH